MIDVKITASSIYSLADGRKIASTRLIQRKY